MREGRGAPQQVAGESNPDRDVREWFRAKTEQRFGELFDAHDAGEDRVRMIIEQLRGRLQPLLDAELPGVDAKTVLEKVEACAAQEERSAFVQCGLEAVRPILEIAERDPAGFEAVLRDSFVRQDGFTPINEMISYGLEGDGWAHIHLAPSRTLTNKRGMIRDALEQLAAIAQQDPEMKGITATSTLVAERPQILERLGFELDGEISQDTHDQHFTAETNPVHSAHMSREQLISRYGGKT